MHLKLKPSAYTSDAEFSKERTNFLNSGWHFLGLKNELKKIGEYQVHSLWGSSVFKQKLADESIVAYSNVCPHRFSRIRCEAYGDEPLVCPYHGWAFDPKNGRAIGIPDKPQFCFSEDDERSLKLDAWQIENCGNFLFASKNPKKSLMEYLSSFGEYLGSYSMAIGEKIDTNSLDIDANWKIVVENTLESYHIKKIHPETFFELGTTGTEFVFDGHHSSWRSDVNDASKKKAKLLNKIFSDRPIVNDYYSHTLVFPTMTIASSFGLSFSIQEIIPLSASKTRFISHVYFSKLEQSRDSNDPTLQSMAKGIKSFNQKVFLEDKIICEKVQLGSYDATSTGHLCLIEKRVEAFQNAILESLK